MRNLNKFLVGLLLCLPVLGNCVEWLGTESVSVSAINYTGQDLNAFLFENPDDPSKVAGGTGLDPYSGGGTMCCYRLPKRWHKGIKVKLRYDWWTGSSDDRRYQYLTVELPRYPTKEPGMLWALFYEDGSVEVVASAVDPGHEKWPGKIKHWPVPSREYKLKLWQQEYDQRESSARECEKFVNSPTKKDFEEIWTAWAEYEKKAIEGFSGPDDPKFQKSAIERFTHSARSYRKEMKAMEASKP